MENSSDLSKSLLTPERRRWIILGLIFFAMVLNYVDRQIVSVLKPTLKAVFDIDDRGYALLINVFIICYAITYAAAGWLVDRFGAGRIMLYGIIAWSSACIGAGFTKTFGQLAFFRGALGVAEPMGFPAQLRVVTIWFPPGLRATANSICAAGSTIGAIIAAPLVAWLALNFNWHAAFFVPGVLGLVIAVLWWIFYRDPPSAAFSGEKAAAPAFRWGQLWRTRSLWGILISRFVSDPVWYFCLFWLPGYLQERSGLTLAQIGMVGWIPFLAADIGGVGSSLFSDRLVKRGVEPLRARKLTLLGAALLAPVCVLTPHFPSAVATLIIFSIVGAVCLTWLFNLGVVVAEAFPSANVGSVWGIAGAFGAAGAMFFNTWVGEIMHTFGPVRVFALMAVLHPLAILILWKMVRKETPSSGNGSAGHLTPAEAIG
ncbi:MFS transporter [Oleiharenicola lentus]|uniref:MFS transporter n=1 Tax=Oleiharenicola lentus TaxID=2508720 RepID=UPI003F669E4E